MTTSEGASLQAQARPAPTDWLGVIKQLGPGHIISALAEAVMLPFLALAVLYFRYCRTAPALRAGGAWTFCLWFATATMTAVGGYQLVTKLRDLVK